MLQELVLVFWLFVVADSTGGLALKSTGALECWYARTFPGLSGLFPVQNGWPVVYFVLAVLGAATAVYAISQGRGGDKRRRIERD